ncbi:2Fe-2S iron-sulfur cluster binding domain-containing protein [Paenibacillus albiflavus]|uniref:2Fe-2S iron-sulfur cluster binding domain-containing protein n=1 Tax=Paenibacillus albiflavus TaxID=2545760 RepID=A0A4R4ELS2_9BACL|nr:2Fe-2S iron-sulfur cluster-binding protein [Paenibacillus albiflavus]TCZ81224.1 2Fe-2S iron-sulfur cluster binding domain-containing protein [Paenibacillus albiflavus]
MNMVEVTFLPDGKKAKVRQGTTLLDASRRANVVIRTRCGGRAGCLMCKVRVDAENQAGLSEPAINERQKLGSELSSGVRLSCQARIQGNVTVTIPEDPLKSAIRKQLEKQRQDDDWMN